MRTAQCQHPNVYKCCNSHSMECESMLFVTIHITYLGGLSNSFSNSFINFYKCEVVSLSDMRKKNQT